MADDRRSVRSRDGVCARRVSCHRKGVGSRVGFHKNAPAGVPSVRVEPHKQPSVYGVVHMGLPKHATCWRHTSRNNPTQRHRGCFRVNGIPRSPFIRLPSIACCGGPATTGPWPANNPWAVHTLGIRGSHIHCHAAGGWSTSTDHRLRSGSMWCAV